MEKKDLTHVPNYLMSSNIVNVIGKELHIPLKVCFFQNTNNICIHNDIQPDISKASPQLFHRKRRKISSHEYFLVLFMKIDKVVTANFDSIIKR